MTTQIVPFEAAQGDKPETAYIVQLPFPYAEAEGEWDDRQAFPADPLGMAKARELATILRSHLSPRVRIIKRTEEVVG